VSSSTTSNATDVDAVVRLQTRWIHGWDKVEDQPLPDFREVFADFYDFDADVIFFDDADPQRRVFRTVEDYAQAFWPMFSELRSAAHAVPEAPEVIVDADLAVGRMVFIAALTSTDGTTTNLRAYNSLVWRRTEARDWHIVRDQTTVEPVPADEAGRAFATG
jgi:ketosteroid isomerase-like protein